MGTVHCVVELFEEGVVFFLSILFAETKRLNAFDEDFGCVGLGPDEFYGFGEVVFERHGAGVGSLLATHQFRLNIRRNEFEDFHVGGFELVAQGLAVGVDGSLGGVVGGCHRHGDKSKAGRDGKDSGIRLLHELRQQGRCKANGAEEVGGDGGLGVGEVGLGEEVFGVHNAGVVDDDVEAGEVGDELCGEGANAGGVFDVEDCGGHAWIGGGGFVKDLLTAAGDDDFIS
jgi:hypothetical protein